MLELPEKFKSALGNGVRTSLFPVIRFYKDVRIDLPDGGYSMGTSEPVSPWSEAESVNLSIKETNLDGIAFDPLLLNTPSIKSSADVINNKYTISSVSLSISNAPYKGKIFSDDVQSLLNAVCQVYYCANGLDKLEDCLLVYTGTVRRFNQSAESIKLTLEDVTEQMLSTQIPESLVPDESFYKKDDIGKPFPMVYGHVDKSPLIPRSVGEDEETGEIAAQITKLHIDKRGKYVKGGWTYPNQLNYGTDFINDGHDLVQNGWLSLDGYLSVYNNGFLPMVRQMPDRWGDGEQDFGNVNIYYFNQTNGIDSSASINISSDVIIISGDVSGIPTRVYRPIKDIQCYTYCDLNQAAGEDDSINSIWGFTGYFDTAEWEPWEFGETVDGRTGYERNWDAGDSSWWEPTACNAHDNGGVTSSIDTNWIANGRGGKFPVSRLQNGLKTEGIYLGGRNLDGTRDSGDNKSGGAYVRMIFEDNVGSFPCTTRVVFDSECHSFQHMDGGASNHHRPYGALFWTENKLAVARGLPDSDDEKIEHLLDSDTDFTFPTIPNKDQDWEHIVIPEQDGTESTVRLYNGSSISTSFNNTTAFNSIQFGVPQYPQRNFTTGNDRGYVSTQLFNCYTLQDAVVDNPIDQDFYADVVGRTYAPSDLEGIITSAWTHFYDGIFTDTARIYFSVSDRDLLLSLINEYGSGILSKIVIENTSDYFNGTYEGFFGKKNRLNFDYSDSILYNAKFPVGGDPNQSWEGDGDYTLEATAPIVTPEYIMEDILKDELNYNGNITMPNEYNNWMHSFTLNEQKEAKEVFEGLFKSSLSIPSFDAQGQFKFLDLRQIIDTTAGLPVVNNEDIIKYSFELSKIDDVKNQVNVKYKKNYASGDFGEETGYSLIDAETPPKDHETYDAITVSMYPGDSSRHYSIDYYGLTSDEAKLEVETEYIRDDLTARKLQKRLVSWYANQHLITKIDLPVKYMDLEVGDYIKFDELLGGKLAFGHDYTRSINKNGQLVYPVFFITKISKSLQKVSIEAIQVHRGEYGFPEIITEEDTEDNVDGGGNDGQGNWDFPDPNDNPSYDDGTIIEEGQQEEEGEEPDPYFDASWEYNLNDITNNPRTAIVSTNILEDWDYDIFITEVYTSTGEGISFPEGSEINPISDGIYSEENAPSAMDIVNHTKTISDMVDNYNGQVLISKKFVFEMDEYPEIVEVTFMIKIYNDNNIQYLTFNQNGEYVDVDILGDINGDFVVNVLDVVLLIQYILSAGTIPDFPIEKADMNGDGEINVLDGVILVNQILGQ